MTEPMTTEEQLATLQKMFDDVVKVVKLRKMVDKQAEEMILWNPFKRTPTETALQKALRELHALIEE